MLFGTRRHRRRRELLDAGFTDAWRDLCDARLDWWRELSDDELQRLEAVALGLVAEADWEPANGFTITEEMQVLIAAQAALLTVNLPYEDPYRDVHAIIVHPTTAIMHGEHSQVDGVYSDDPTPILGQAEMHGPVLVAWDEVEDDVAHHGDGRNVVYHEFAHKLDMLDGVTDGTPPMAAELAGRWVPVCTEVYEAVVEGRGGEVLDDYAGVNPAEFFAVATEAFFDDGIGLQAEHPDLYGCFRDFYGQDPAGWYEG
ncbi:M90 family metallopeptidase [Dermatobacter hominis]|uniref:M90 family metallopeptidase n=1 Tax=Dermatobacter hominis TaxID=2884263 RepID=UPI001D12534F|nr:M90 family metallopeptidase [Dermatobacter hominis]UDY34767.1 zinc-dependent peptidase [Dermatobacter hominis]